MKRFRKLARHFCVNLFILFSLLLHHIPLAHSMTAAFGLAEGFAALLGLSAAKTTPSKHTNRWAQTEGSDSLRDLCLSLMQGNLKEANAIIHVYDISQSIAEDNSNDTVVAFEQLQQNLTKQAPSSSSIYTLLKSVQTSYAQEEPYVTPSPLRAQESTQEHVNTLPTAQLNSPSLANISTSHTNIPSITIPVHPSVFTSPRSKEEIERANQRVDDREMQQALQRKSELDQEQHANMRKLQLGVMTGIGVVKLIGDRFKDAHRIVAQQIQQDEEFEKAINSHPLAKKAYHEAIHQTVAILLKAHSAYTHSSEQNHALLALNHINLHGKAGRYLRQVIETVNYHHFDDQGLLKALHPNINYKHTVDMLIPLFQHIAHDQNEYNAYLHSLEQAFTSQDKETALSKEIHTRIKEERTKEFKQATESEFKAALYEMLPQSIKTMGKREQSGIANNALNREFIEVINNCLVDFTDPQQDPLSSFAHAEKRISECKNHRYQQCMRQFYEAMHTRVMGNTHSIPLIFKNDPHAYINPPTSLEERKQRIHHLAERYQLKKKLRQALGIKESSDETIDKLLYTLITPEYKQLYTSITPQTLPSANKIVDHLLTCKDHRYKPLSDDTFNQFFTSQGISKVLQPKLKDYPELSDAQLLAHPNKELLRYANYFLALGNSNKRQIKQGISYICAAAESSTDSLAYLSLAKAQYKALTDATADTTILAYPLTPQTYKNSKQKAAHHATLALAAEAVTLLDKEQAAVNRYALKAAYIAQTLNAAGKPEDAASIVHNIAEMLKKPNHTKRSFELLSHTIDIVRTLPGVFDAHNLLGIALREDLNACKPDLIKKSAETVEKYLKILESAKPNIKSKKQKAVHAQLQKSTNIAEKVLKQISEHSSPQGIVAALHADLLVRLTYQAHILNITDKTQEALDLIHKFEPTLILECEAYLNNSENKPPQGVPCSIPTTTAEPLPTTCNQESKASEVLPQSCNTGKADNLKQNIPISPIELSQEPTIPLEREQYDIEADCNDSQEKDQPSNVQVNIHPPAPDPDEDKVSSKKNEQEQLQRLKDEADCRELLIKIDTEFVSQAIDIDKLKEMFELFKDAENIFAKNSPLRIILEIGSRPEKKPGYLGTISGAAYELEAAEFLTKRGYKIKQFNIKKKGYLKKGSVQSKQFDLLTDRNLLIECKAHYWDKIQDLQKTIADLKIDIGKGYKVAIEATNMDYALCFKHPIPQELKEWLQQRAIIFFESSL